MSNTSSVVTLIPPFCSTPLFHHCGELWPYDSRTNPPRGHVKNASHPSPPYSKDPSRHKYRFWSTLHFHFTRRNAPTLLRNRLREIIRVPTRSKRETDKKRSADRTGQNGSRKARSPAEKVDTDIVITQTGHGTDIETVEHAGKTAHNEEHHVIHLDQHGKVAVGPEPETHGHAPAPHVPRVTGGEPPEAGGHAHKGPPPHPEHAPHGGVQHHHGAATGDSGQHVHLHPGEKAQLHQRRPGEKAMDISIDSDNVPPTEVEEVLFALGGALVTVLLFSCYVLCCQRGRSEKRRQGKSWKERWFGSSDKGEDSENLIGEESHEKEHTSSHFALATETEAESDATQKVTKTESSESHTKDTETTKGESSENEKDKEKEKKRKGSVKSVKNKKKKKKKDDEDKKKDKDEDGKDESKPEKKRRKSTSKSKDKQKKKKERKKSSAGHEDEEDSSKKKKKDKKDKKDKDDKEEDSKKSKRRKSRDKGSKKRKKSKTDTSDDEEDEKGKDKKGSKNKKGSKKDKKGSKKDKKGSKGKKDKKGAKSKKKRYNDVSEVVTNDQDTNKRKRSSHHHERNSNAGYDTDFSNHSLFYEDGESSSSQTSEMDDQNCSNSCTDSKSEQTPALAARNEPVLSASSCTVLPPSQGTMTHHHSRTRSPPSSSKRQQQQQQDHKPEAKLLPVSQSVHQRERLTALRLRSFLARDDDQSCSADHEEGSSGWEVSSSRGRGEVGGVVYAVEQRVMRGGGGEEHQKRVVEEKEGSGGARGQRSLGSMVAALAEENVAMDDRKRFG